MVELGLLVLLFFLMALVFYRKKSQKTPWTFLSRWRLFSSRQREPSLPLFQKSKEGHPMSAQHLQSKSWSRFKGMKNREEAQEPSRAFVHLESVVSRIQSRFLSHQSLGPKGLLGDTVIDQKAFMDCFRNEKGVIVAFYHCEERRMIFVSASVKTLLGYGPSDFRMHFHEILQDLPQWEFQLEQLRARNKIYLPVALYRDSFSGSLCAWDAYLALLQRGATHYVAILFYPAFCQANVK